MTLEMIEQATLWSSAGLVAERPCWGGAFGGKNLGWTVETNGCEFRLMPNMHALKIRFNDFTAS